MSLYKMRPDYINQTWWINWCRGNGIAPDTTLDRTDGKWYHNGRLLNPTGNGPELYKMKPVSNTTFKDLL